MSDEITRYDMSIEWGSMCGCEVVYVSDGEYVRYADYAALRAQLTTAERERDEARRERDDEIARVVRLTERLGNEMHRAERAERYERLWNRHAVVIHQAAKEDVIGPIHGDRTVIGLPFGYVVRGHAEGFVGMEDAVRALDAAEGTP